MEKAFKKLSLFRPLIFSILAVIGTISIFQSHSPLGFYAGVVFVVCQLLLVLSDCLKRV